MACWGGGRVVQRTRRVVPSRTYCFEKNAVKHRYRKYMERGKGLLGVGLQRAINAFCRNNFLSLCD